MVVVIVVCLVLSGLAFWKGREAWTSGPVSNQAVVDVGATAEIVGQTRESIEKIFSYDFTKLDDSVDAARTMSTGAFTQQYLSVFDQTIRTPATQQQLRQTATVVNIGVNSIRGDSAQVMALVQFNAQRTSTGESTNAPGLLRLDMQRVDGRWKLAQLTPLTAPR
jgi:Mce-associated membrane protein